MKKVEDAIATNDTEKIKSATEGLNKVWNESRRNCMHSKVRLLVQMVESLLSQVNRKVNQNNILQRVKKMKVMLKMHLTKLLMMIKIKAPSVSPLREIELGKILQMINNLEVIMTEQKEMVESKK